MQAPHDRLPPQNLEAEQSVLGAMLMSKDAISEVVESLRSEDFYKPSHQVLFDAVITLYNSGEPVDAITAANELERNGDLTRVGGKPYLFTLVSSVPAATSAAYYASIVREHSVLRRLVEAGTRITQLGYSTDGDEVDNLVDQAQQQVYAITEAHTATDYVPISQILGATLESLETAAEDSGPRGVLTGFYDLDHQLKGLRGGQMIIIAARPAKGKSTLALDICRNASIRAGVTSVIFSLEMGQEEITTRLLAAEGAVDMGWLQAPTKEDGAKWAVIANTINRISPAPLYIDDSPNVSMMEIRAKCRRLKQRNNLGLVVVDYLQLMSSGKRVESRQQEVSEFSRSLKLLAKELDVPLIAVAQLNRGPEARAAKRPQMSDLRESGSLEQDADMVLLLHREDETESDAPIENPNVTQVIVAKNRNGKAGVVELQFEGHYTRFNNLARDIEPPPGV